MFLQMLESVVKGTCEIRNGTTSRTKPTPVTKENFMLKQFSEQELLGKPRSPEQEAEILALQTMGDETIDFSDIPEIRAIPAGAVRGKFYSPWRCCLSR